MDEKWLTATQKEKKDYIDSLYCHYPRLEVLLGRINYCHQNSKRGREPKCLFIKGPAGVGKSTLGSTYEERYPRYLEDGITIVPVINAMAPVQASIRALASELLAMLGDPANNVGSTAMLTSRLHNLIRTCKVEIIILDEFQHFIDSESDKLLLNTANWLKELINKTGVPVVLIGMPSSESIFFGRDQNQLSRRFKYRESFEPFSWNTPEQILEFRQFLKAFDESLPLPESSGLSHKVNAFRMMYATDGIVDNVQELIKEAAKLAVERNLTAIDNSLLSEAFLMCVKSVLGWKLNPFVDTVHSLSDIDPNYVPEPELIMNSTTRSKKKRKDKASDFLTAVG